ncbi:MAG: isoprenylcysteine carboxylmethyltransferase family protein [Bradyrhizobiaceae bacterium]|nr:isoprenylcysteine carboxylmethyltransferase family protein [Bradyrhizobiaceae bacterium]
MTPTIAKIIWLGCVISWWLIRYPYERKVKKNAIAATRRDTQELILLGISLSGLGIIPIVYVFAGFGGFAERPFVPALAWAGLVPALGSLWLFWRTHKELGRNWSVSLEVRDKHELITSGVYRYVRHPMYSAFFLWAIAQFLLLPNWVAGISGIIGFGTLYAFRVGREEELMLEAFGDQYRAYMARTARIVPWVF